MRRRAWLVTALAVLLTGLSGWYSVSHLAIDTDAADMLSAELPFRQDSIRLDQAFPQLSKNIVVVIDGDTADQADDAASLGLTPKADSSGGRERMERISKIGVKMGVM